MKTGFRLLIAFAAFALFLTAAPLSADENDNLDTLVETYLASEDGEEQAKLREEILSLSPKADTLRKALAAGIAYGGVEPAGEYVEFHTDATGTPRHASLYVPSKYDAAKKHRMLVSLHGGIGGTMTEGGKSGVGLWRDYPEETNTFILAPSGNRDCVWWTAQGEKHINACIDYVKRRYNIDENRVYMSGFSDGASACFYYAGRANDRFAGYLPFCGYVGVIAMVRGHVLPANFRNRPIYANNGALDGLYPIKEVEKTIKELKRYGADVTFRRHDELGHDFGVDEKYWLEMFKWMDENPREPYPETVYWECLSENENNRCDWLEIAKVGEAESNFEFPEPADTGKKPGYLGVQMDPTYSGGARVQAVMPGSAAGAAGLKAGDVILAIDGEKIESLTDVSRILSAKFGGDTVTISVKRDARTEDLPATLGAREIFRKSPRGRALATRDGNSIDIKTNRVREVAVYISPDVFDLSKPVKITINGKLLFDKLAESDIALMLDEALKLDRTRCYTSRISLVVDGEKRESGQNNPPERSEF